MSKGMIWTDYLNDIAKAAEAYEVFLGEARNFDTGIGFHASPIRFILYGEDTGWSLEVIDDAVYLVIDEKED